MSGQLSPNLEWKLANPLWASVLNPIISSPMSQVHILNTIALASGRNVINHGLGKMNRGWFLTDINGAATVYRSGDFNDKTLILTSSAAVTVSIGVF